MTEYYDVLTKDRQPTGRVNPRGTPLGPDEYRSGAEIMLFHKDGRLMVTRRHLLKIGDPGKWECTGGLVRAGETTLEAIIRETGEEVGVILAPQDVRFVATYDCDRQYLDLYTATVDMDISELTLQEDEVIDAKYVTRDELRAMHESGEFIDGVYNRVMALTWPE